MTIFLSLILFSGELQKVTIRPFDFQSENKPETFVRGMWSLYGQEENLLFIPKGDPYVLQIDIQTNEVSKIGGKGHGPGELGNSFPWALSLNRNSMWVLNTSKTRASLFKNGAFHTSFRVKSYQLVKSYQPKFSFAHNELFVVLPAHPASRHLANVYDYSGEVVTKMGDILPIDPEQLKWNPALNNTMWQFHAGKWYCLFMYRPIIRIFNDQFQLEKEILIMGPEVDIYEERFHKLEVNPMIADVLPHFTDFQVTRTHIYAMCHGVLYRMTHQGKVISRTGFYANKEVQDQLGYQPRIHFEHVVILRDKFVYLGSQGSPYFDHDLWYANLAK